MGLSPNPMLCNGSGAMKRPSQMETSVAMGTLEREIVLLDFLLVFLQTTAPNQVALRSRDQRYRTHRSNVRLRRSVLEPQLQHTHAIMRNV